MGYKSFLSESATVAELCQGKEKRLLNKTVSHVLVINASLQPSKSTKVIPCQTYDPFSIKLMQLILDFQSNPIRKRVSVHQPEILRILFLRKKNWQTGKEKPKLNLEETLYPLFAF